MLTVTYFLRQECLIVGYINLSVTHDTIDGGQGLTFNKTCPVAHGHQIFSVDH